jgi:hypothetical protein
MRSLLLRCLSVAVLTIGMLILLAPPAQAQGHCVPLSGTMYLWLTDTWHGVADFTIGRNLLHANFLSVNTSFFDGGDVWQGTENWTLDFGKGNKIHVKVHFVTQHMTDAVSSAGVYDIVEVGPFTNGRGVFKNAYGNMSIQGPFGPNVKLPDNIQPPPDAQWFSVVESQGMICGLNDRN